MVDTKDNLRTNKKRKTRQSIYSFLIRKRHSYIKRYKKIPVSGIDIILGRGPKLKKEKEEMRFIRKKEKKTKRIPKKLIAVIVILLILGGLFYIMPKGANKKEIIYNVPSGALVVPSATAGIANIGNNFGSLKNIAYIFLRYSTKDSTNTTLSIDLYNDYDTKEIYLLERGASWYNAGIQDNYLDFKNSLNDDAIRKGYNFHISDLKELKTVKNSIIIIPSGRLPVELAKNGLIYNLSKDNIVIYIGLQFDRINTEEGLINNQDCSGTVCGDLRFISKDSPSFNKRCYGIHLDEPEYVVSRVSVTQPKVEMIYGCISEVPFENGNLILIPEALDYGWDSGNDCASDVIKLIDESAWHKPISSVKYIINETSGEQTFFSGTFDKNIRSVYAKVRLSMKNLQHDSQKIAITQINQIPLGTITVNPYQTIPFKFSNREIELEISTNEPGPSRQIKPFAQLKKNNVVLPEKKQLLEMNTKEYPNSIPAQLAINEPGEYIIEITDGISIFASGYAKISDIRISSDEKDYRRGNFRFSFKDELGNPVIISHVRVYFNDKFIQEFKKTSSVSFKGLSVSPGEQEFKFDFGGGNVKLYSDVYTPPNPFVDIITKPINMVLLIITVIAVVIALGIKRKERPVFSLDIPDFPPLAFRKIYIKPEEVMEIFEQVNHDYSWRYMPLSLEEIKKGFLKYIHRGENLVIGEYNLQILLDRMIDKGYVKERKGYYLLSRWEDKSKKSAKFLVIYRQLRNIFVDNTIKFTKLGVSKDSDLEITTSGEHMHIFIYDNNLKEIFDKIVKLISYGNILIIFDNESDKQRFLDEITSPSKSLIWFKLEIESGEIIPLSIDELVDYITTIKGQ